VTRSASASAVREADGDGPGGPAAQDEHRLERRD
jgi:hypothetical protein